MIQSRFFFFRLLVDPVLKLLGCDRALDKRLRFFLDDHVSQYLETAREGRCQRRGGLSSKTELVLLLLVEPVYRRHEFVPILQDGFLRLVALRLG